MKKLVISLLSCCFYFNCASAQSFDAAYMGSSYINPENRVFWMQYAGTKLSKNENLFKQLESGKLVYVVYP